MVGAKRQRGSRVCVCGHDWEAHNHYRRGSDCAHCDCIRWRRAGLRLFSWKRPS